MKLITFTYEKPNGDVSGRTLYIHKLPVTIEHYSGIDLSSSNTEDATSFVKEAEVLSDRHQQEFTQLKAKYDLAHNYRQFKPERMSDICVID